MTPSPWDALLDAHERILLDAHARWLRDLLREARPDVVCSGRERLGE